MQTSIISGCNGQDGSYLSELLLSKDYHVVGLVRRTSLPNTARIQHLLGHDRFDLVTCDVTDPSGINRVVHDYKPDEIYNCAAMSHVGASFNDPVSTTSVVLGGCLNFLEAIRTISPRTRFYQASSSEMFGSMMTYDYEDEGVGERLSVHSTCPPRTALRIYQNEYTPFLPNSPYAVAKTAAHNLVRVYKQSYGLFACAGILFNHESPRRGQDFVTQKIIHYINQVRSHTEKLRLGNVDAARDWGWAKDYVSAMWMMLQQDQPEDYVIATGEVHTVRDFLAESFQLAGLGDWQDYVDINSPEFLRPNDVPYLCGDASKAQRQLGWKPTITFKELVEDMLTGEDNA